MAKRDTNTMPVGHNSTSLTINANGNRQVDGYVSTVHGFVIVYSVHWYESGEGSTTLQLVYDGRMRTRYEDKFYWPRTLVTIAKRFAAEIAGKEQSK